MITATMIPGYATPPDARQSEMDEIMVKSCKAAVSQPNGRRGMTDQHRRLSNQRRGGATTNQGIRLRRIAGFGASLSVVQWAIR